MKKVAVVLSALMLAVVMVGCAKQISGTPSEVVEECQSIATNEVVEATVTGYITSPGTVGESDGTATFMMGDTSGLSGGQYSSIVYVMVNNPSEAVQKLSYGDRVTAKGHVGNITSSSIMLRDVTVS